MTKSFFLKIEIETTYTVTKETEMESKYEHNSSQFSGLIPLEGTQECYCQGGGEAFLGWKSAFLAFWGVRNFLLDFFLG